MRTTTWSSTTRIKVTIWRTIQKDENTTQKKTLSDSSTTQKNENTTQKRILEYLRNNPKATRVEVAKALGDITEDGVKFVISKLRQKGLLVRIGGRKNGEWKVFSVNS